MNPQGGPAEQVNAHNENNKTEVSPHLSVESLQRLLPLFPLTTESDERFLDGLPQPHMNLPQQVNERNNPSTDLDLSLTLGRQGAIRSPIVAPEYAVQEKAMHGGTSANTVHLPNKRSFTDHASREFVRGESSNMGEQAALAKRRVTESHVSANNDVNPSPVPQMQVQQPFSETARTEPIQGHQHVSPQNEAAPTPQPHAHVNRIANNYRRGVHVNPYPQTVGDIMAPLHGQRITQGGNMLGHQVATVNVLGNFPNNSQQNRPYIDSDGVFVGRTPSLRFPQRFNPAEPLQLLAGFVDDNGRVRNARAIIYQPLSEQVGPSASGPSQGSRDMNHSTAVSNSGTQNHHSLVPMSALQPRVNYEPSPLQQFPTDEMSRRLPSEVQTILDQLRIGRTLMFEYYPYEELMVLDYSQVLHALETRSSRQNDARSRRGLSIDAIMHHIRREIFTPGDKEKCVICLEDYEDGDEIGKLDLCVHKFHVHCIKRWLMIRNTCPICKRIALTMNNVENEAGAAVNNEDVNA